MILIFFVNKISKMRRPYLSIGHCFGFTNLESHNIGGQGHINSYLKKFPQCQICTNNEVLRKLPILYVCFSLG